MPLNHRALADAARQEAARLVRLAAEPRGPNEKIKVSIMRAAARLGLSYRRAEDIWRMEARRIDAWEMDLLRKAGRNHRTRRNHRA